MMFDQNHHQLFFGTESETPQKIIFQSIPRKKNTSATWPGKLSKLDELKQRLVSKVKRKSVVVPVDELQTVPLQEEEVDVSHPKHIRFASIKGINCFNFSCCFASSEVVVFSLAMNIHD